MKNDTPAHVKLLKIPVSVALFLQVASSSQALTAAPPQLQNPVANIVSRQWDFEERFRIKAGSSQPGKNERCVNVPGNKYTGIIRDFYILNKDNQPIRRWLWNYRKGIGGNSWISYSDAYKSKQSLALRYPADASSYCNNTQKMEYHLTNVNSTIPCRRCKPKGLFEFNRIAYTGFAFKLGTTNQEGTRNSFDDPKGWILIAQWRQDSAPGGSPIVSLQAYPVPNKSNKIEMRVSANSGQTPKGKHKEFVPFRFFVDKNKWNRFVLESSFDPQVNGNAYLRVQHNGQYLSVGTGQGDRDPGTATKWEHAIGYTNLVDPKNSNTAFAIDIYRLRQAVNHVVLFDKIRIVNPAKNIANSSAAAMADPDNW
ncbi:MAG: heparin lyase I family protein [Thermosynechococcaceae cyanobacterium]